MEQVYQYRSEIQEIPKIKENLSHLAESWTIPESELRQIGIILEELFSNIVRFAFNDHKEHQIEIKLQKINSLITITIIDDGFPFNPLEYSPKPLTDPLATENRGMGLTLIRTFSDSIVYNRIGLKNCLEITKKIKSQP